MIKLDGVNKYFNRFKKNQIHVINNTTISFPSSGLVALLGPSGCGKTTLLNVIGGLDEVNSGNIHVNGEKITKRRSTKIDEIRNLNIGYIFRDYKLVEHMSVFENVALSLKIIGIKDKEEIKKRVLYTLDKVNQKVYFQPVNCPLKRGTFFKDQRSLYDRVNRYCRTPLKVVLKMKIRLFLDFIGLLNILRVIKRNFYKL